MTRAKSDFIFHPYLRKQRLELGLTLREMAEWLGIPHSRYQGYEHLRIRLKAADRAKMAHMFECDEDGLDLPWGPYVRELAPRKGQKVQVDYNMDQEKLRRIGEYYQLSQYYDDPAQIIQQQDMSQHLHEVFAEILDKLRPVFKEVLQRRFGLNGETPSTLEEVGRVLNVTRERVRQLEDQAVRQIQSQVLAASAESPEPVTIYKQLVATIRDHWDLNNGAYYEKIPNYPGYFYIKRLDATPQT